MRNPNRRGFSAGDHIHGLSLIELMVGMVISLICVLGMMSAFSIYEGRKRTVTSGGDAQQNGLYSLFELERQVRTAGSGLTQGFNYGLWGCSITAYGGNARKLPSATAMPAVFAAWPSATPVKMRVVPVLIASGGNDTAGNAKPDTLAIVGGNPAGTVFRASVVGASGTAAVTLDNAFGFAANDYVLATTSTGECSMAKIASASSSSSQLTLSAADSPPTGLAVDGSVFDIGNQPSVSLYGIDTSTSTLVTYDMLGRNGATPLTIADGVVQLKALYGIDSDGDDVVDTWVQPVGDWAIDKLTVDQASAAAAFAKIKAVRIAVVAQSLLPERAADYSGASTLTLFGDLDAGLRYTVGTQPQYRYKVYDTVIPIRNAIITRHF
ncbi:PilW family protein [Dyella sp. BiH032]|uniref:PilW family protein n=1 Tax=Dyella sp. BiH032 TaxID=3075430 RepID=UPI002893518F|nr:PilW family protein [Dyella sp. BiH032]WNL48050.1 PilW family protein [Dyella sp. BiH032]